MKKNEFISLVAERTDMSKKDTEKIVDAVFAALGDLMVQGAFGKLAIALLTFVNF